MELDRDWTEAGAKAGTGQGLGGGGEKGNKSRGNKKSKYPFWHFGKNRDTNSAGASLRRPSADTLVHPIVMTSRNPSLSKC